MADIFNLQGECISRDVPIADDDAEIFSFFREHSEFVMRQYGLDQHAAAERAYIRARVEFGGDRVDAAVDRYRGSQAHE
jgi:hypothetical protein